MGWFWVVLLFLCVLVVVFGRERGDSGWLWDPVGFNIGSRMRVKVDDARTELEQCSGPSAQLRACVRALFVVAVWRPFCILVSWGGAAAPRTSPGPRTRSRGRLPPGGVGEPPWEIKLYLCYAILLPGRKSSFRVRFRQDSNRESIKIGPPAGRRLADVEAFPCRIRPKSYPEDRFSARSIIIVT